MRFYMGKYVTIYKSALWCIGQPKAIQLFWSASDNALLIGKSGIGAPQAIKVEDYVYGWRGSLKLYGKQLMNAIYHHTGLDKNKDLKTIGEYIPELNMVRFKLNSSAAALSATHRSNNQAAGRETYA
jgi:hypothetical protein